MNETFLNIETYEDFKNLIISKEELFSNLKVEFNIPCHYNLTYNNIKFTNHIPCLKKDTSSSILEKYITNKKTYWYKKYINSLFRIFICNNEIRKDDNKIEERLYVYCDKPLNTLTYNNLKFKKDTYNYMLLKSLNLFESIKFGINGKYVYRIK